MNHHTIEATFEITTPMFIGSADHRTSELSAKALKSAIMFWWRTLNYDRYHGDLSMLNQQERSLFGGIKSQTGQEESKASKQSEVSSIRTLIYQVDTLKTSCIEFVAKYKCKFSDQPKPLGRDIKYLLGQGLVPTQKSEERQYLQSGQQFKVRFISKKPFHDSFVQSLQALGLVGSLGARSLKGFGSIQLLECDGKSYANDSVEQYELRVKSLFSPESINDTNRYGTAIPSVQNCRVDISKEFSSANQVLQNLGAALFQYRTNATVDQNTPSYENFKKDCDWFMGKPGVPDDFHPERVVFGLPHNYFVHKPKQREASIDPASADLERRESPLRFHVHKLANKRYVGVLIYFKSDFLPPENNQLAMNRAGRDLKPVTMMSAYKQAQIICDFMSCKPRPGSRMPQKDLLECHTIVDNDRRQAE